MTEYVLWGFHPAYVDGTPIKLTGGNLRRVQAQQTVWTGEGWTCAVHLPGTSPVGLRAQAQSR